MESTNVTNCYTTGNITCNAYVGGLAGQFYAYNGTFSISNSYSTCNVKGTSDYIGGLIGQTSNSYATLSILNCYTAGNVGGNNFTGGLIGYNGSNSTVSYCYATGNVNSTGNNYVGGLVGYNYNSSSIIENSVAANPSVICAQNANNINRIAGNTDGTFRNNYATEVMVVQANGIGVTITEYLNTNAGAGKALNALNGLNALTFYNTASNWYDTQPWSIVAGIDNTKSWNICDGISFPFLQWQKITNCSFTITATQGAGGTITPSGNVSVNRDAAQKFTITPNSGYKIDRLLVNGVHILDSVASLSYTFTKITQNHTIQVTFRLESICGGDGSE
jgi:hypothetical protein